VNLNRYLILMTLLALGLTALGYCQNARAAEPSGIVQALDARYALNGALDRAWVRECSGQTVPGRACGNHRIGGRWVGERGAFQMTRSAARHSAVRCEHRRLGQPGQFGYEAECAARYLRYWIGRYGDQAQGEIAYVRGFCSSIPKITASR
jgi:hypothetical protein